jgi:hypothetical protein
VILAGSVFVGCASASSKVPSTTERLEERDAQTMTQAMTEQWLAAEDGDRTYACDLWLDDPDEAMRQTTEAIGHGGPVARRVIAAFYAEHC